MSTFVCISDTHNQHARLLVPPGDFLLHAGDFTNMGRIEEVIPFLKWFQKQPHKHRVFCAGNHDWMCQKNPDLFATLVKEHAPDCHYLYDQTIELDGWVLHGSPWSPFFLDWAFNAYRGGDIQHYWDKIPDSTQVLITHGPPHETLDMVEWEGREGCVNLKKTIRTRLKSLELSLFGHLHYEGCQTVVQDGVIYANGAVVNDDYKLRGQIQVVELFS